MHARIGWVAGLGGQGGRIWRWITLRPSATFTVAALYISSVRKLIRSSRLTISGQKCGKLKPMVKCVRANQGVAREGP